MTRKPVFVRRIWQVDKTHFSIEWSDGNSMSYQLATLQRQCPCASCSEENRPPITDDLQASAIRSVGRYALRIDFSSGCSNGIFRFDQLYSIGKKAAAKQEATHETI